MSVAEAVEPYVLGWAMSAFPMVVFTTTRDELDDCGICDGPCEPIAVVVTRPRLMPPVPAVAGWTAGRWEYRTCVCADALVEELAYSMAHRGAEIRVEVLTESEAA
jgi:hypothetical protein